MAIRFDKVRWEQVKEVSSHWWEGKLKRPLIQITVHGANPDRTAPSLPFHHFTAQYGIETPSESIIDAWDYQLSSRYFLGDAFPTLWPNFGPGILAAFIGANVKVRPETVWFHPEKHREINELSFSLDTQNVWLDRICSICREAMNRWEGLVQVGMTDLGGTLDVLSTFRPSEGLLTDLYIYPDEVKRCIWQVWEFWWKSYETINASLQPTNPGYTGWLPVFSETPYYVLQSDFSYMIGPDLFDEFVKPELTASCNTLGNAFYHLDGVGQLAHLDSLLQIENLKGIQWVPGDGQPPIAEWPQVYKKIRDAGKRIQIGGKMSTFHKIVQDLGSTEGILFTTSCTISELSEAQRFLERYGVPHGYIGVGPRLTC